MRRTTVLLVTLLATALVLGACGGSKSSGIPIRIEGAWARMAPAVDSTTGTMGAGATTTMAMSTTTMAMGAAAGSGSNGAAYFKVVNTGTSADALLSVKADVADMAQLHKTTVESGVMKMREVDRIDVPANGSAELKPGGYHVMMMGLKHSLVPGDKVKLTLRFDKAGTIEVEAVVKEA